MSLSRVPGVGVPGVGVLVHNLDSPGGMERQAARLAAALAERGSRVTVVTTRRTEGAGLPLPSLAELVERAGALEVVRVPTFTRWPEEAALRLYELAACVAFSRPRRPVHVIYAVHWGCGVHAARIARVVRRPVVVKFACAGEYGDFHELTRGRDAGRSLAALREAERYVSLSDELEAEARAAGLDPARSLRIPNGVDLRAFSDAVTPAALPELGPTPGRKVVLFVGRLDRQKRVDVLLRAFALVAARFPAARLALAGRGPLEGELRSLTRELGLAERVALLGPRSDVPALQRAASVFVLPSAGEGLSNALLEAFAAGTPAVASDLVANRTLATHEREALLVPVDDVPALARAIERLLEDPALGARLAAGARTRAAREFSLDAVAERYEAAFAELALRAPRERSPRGDGPGLQLRLAAELASFAARLARSLPGAAAGLALRRLDGRRG